jgi:hypothetical protein
LEPYGYATFRNVVSARTSLIAVGVRVHGTRNMAIFVNQQHMRARWHALGRMPNVVSMQGRKGEICNEADHQG